MANSLCQCDHHFEVDIARYLTSEPLRSDSANHCVPVPDILHVPDESCQVVECFRQFFEVLDLALKHLATDLSNRVAHRSVCTSRHYSRTQRPTK
ncbi:hypothetical protein BDR03DRAFT_964023 [Suillus americanus]|nr:hypothetical protein BDR03DRAFT_964023 [Suillus americanus]